MESCAGADAFMDTLIRFLDGPENNAEIIRGFAEKVFSLLAVAARNVEINCHTQKSYANRDEMGPDMFRGSGDITAFLSNGYGLMQTDAVKNEIFRQMPIQSGFTGGNAQFHLARPGRERRFDH